MADGFSWQHERIICVYKKSSSAKNRDAEKINFKGIIDIVFNNKM